MATTIRGRSGFSSGACAWVRPTAGAGASGAGARRVRHWHALDWIRPPRSLRWGGAARLQVEAVDGQVRLLLRGVHYRAWRVRGAILRVVYEDLDGRLHSGSLTLAHDSEHADYDRAQGTIRARLPVDGLRQVFAK